MISDLAHEVRTPIAILQGNLEELVDEAAQPTPKRLASLHEEVLRLGALVEDLDALAHADVPVVLDTPASDRLGLGSEFVRKTMVVGCASSARLVPRSQRSSDAASAIPTTAGTAMPSSTPTSDESAVASGGRCV